MSGRDAECCARRTDPRKGGLPPGRYVTRPQQLRHSPDTEPRRRRTSSFAPPANEGLQWRLPMTEPGRPWRVRSQYRHSTGHACRPCEPSNEQFNARPIAGIAYAFPDSAVPCGSSRAPGMIERPGAARAVRVLARVRRRGGDAVLARAEAAAALHEGAERRAGEHRPRCCTAARRRSRSRPAGARATRARTSPARDAFSIPRRGCSTTSASSARRPSRSINWRARRSSARCASRGARRSGRSATRALRVVGVLSRRRRPRGDLQLHVRRGVRGARRRTTPSAIAFSRRRRSTKGYYWHCDAMRNEIVASYFPTARHVIAETLRRAGWRRRRRLLGDPPQRQRPQLGHPARPHRHSARASLGPQHRAHRTHARRRQLHQSARRGRRRQRASRRSPAALLLRLRRALDGAGTGGMTMRTPPFDSPHRRHGPARPRRAGATARRRCALARASCSCATSIAGGSTRTRARQSESRHSRSSAISAPMGSGSTRGRAQQVRRGVTGDRSSRRRHDVLAPLDARARREHRTARGACWSSPPSATSPVRVRVRQHRVRRRSAYGRHRRDDVDARRGLGERVRAVEVRGGGARAGARGDWVDPPIEHRRLRRRRGDVTQLNAVHRALQLYRNGLAAMMPGVVGSTVDAVTTSYVGRRDRRARASRRALAKGGAPLRGRRRASAARAARHHVGALGASTPAWRRRGIPRPALADLRTYALFERSVEEIGDPSLKRVARALSHFVPQLAMPKRFETTTADALLGAPAPAVRDFWIPMLDRPARDQLGRAATRAA